MPDEPWWRDAVPSRPRRVEGGIQINSTRGPVARTWWSKRFLQVLESLGVGGRLARGRTYARQGQIISLTVAAGSVTAQVQGSRARPYKVRIGVPAFGKAEWSAVLGVLAADASFTAALLNGQLPREIEDVFAAAGRTLFPDSARDLTMDCTCPDLQVPCKHLAAVFYLLAERFDADPFTILTLRGRDRETFLDDLRNRRTTEPAPDGLPPLTAVLDTFFTAGQAPGLGDTAPLLGPGTRTDALLDQVPTLPVAIGSAPLAELLRPAYLALGDGLR